MQSNSTPEELFVILIQLSRFFKEFSIFESNNTHDFCHRIIKGKSIMNSISDEASIKTEKIKSSGTKDFINRIKKYINDG